MKAGAQQITAVLLASILVAGCSKTEEISRLTGEAAEAETRGDHDTAIARWTSALVLDPQNGEARRRRAALFQATGSFEKAIGDYTEYLRLPTNNPTPNRKLPFLKHRVQPAQYLPFERASAFCQRGFLYAKQGDFDKGVADLNEAFRLNPGEPTTYVSRAQIYEMKGDPEKALTFYTKAVQVASNEAIGYTQRGAFHARRGRTDEAIADLNEAVRLDPQNPQALMHRGLVSARHGETEQALDDLDAAVHASPAEPDVHAARGAILLEMGRFKEALDDFNRTLLLRPNDPIARARRGAALIKKGNLELALEDLNEAIRLNPGEAMFYGWRGSAHSATSQFDQAIGDFDRAIQLQPTEAAFYAARGSVYGKEYKYDKAAADFIKAVLLNPGSPEACNNLAWLRGTCPDDSLRDGEEAVKLATKGCELTGFKVPGLVDTLAAAYAEIGDFDQASRYEKLSLELASDLHKDRSAMQERLSLYLQHKPFRQKTGQ